jgi:hypothetical protein
MAVQSRVNWLGGQRVDLPDLLATDSYTINDIRNFLMSLTGDTSFVVKGLEVTGWSGLTISVKVADSLVFCPNNPVAPFYKGLTADLDLTAALQSNSEIFLELVLETSTEGPVSKGFWDSLAITADSPAGSEYTETVDAQKVVIPKLVQRFGGFTPNSIKIAKITTGPSDITSVVDSRELFFRLATGGTAPDSAYVYPWDTTVRQEPPQTSSIPSQLSSTDPASVYYANTINGTVLNDKGIKSFKDWLNATMSVLKEIKGTPTWYQDAASSSGYPINLSLLSLFLDSQAGHSILAIPSATVFWGKTTAGVPDNILRSEGVSTVQWQINYGYPVKWQLGGTYSSGRVYSNVNFTSPSIDDGDSLYLTLQREVRLTNSPVDWKPTISPGGGLDSTKSVEGNGLFIGVAVGDYIKKESDGILSYYRVEKLYDGTSVFTTEGTVADATIRAVELDRVIPTQTSEPFRYFRARYSNADLQVRGVGDVPANDVNWYWIGRRTGSTFYFRDYGNLSEGEEIEVIDTGATDENQNDFAAEPILVLNPDVAYVSNVLAFNPTLLSPIDSTVYLSFHKRKTNNRINSNSTQNPAIFTYQMDRSVTLGSGQELWVKISDSYSATPYVLTSGSVDDVNTTNVFEIRQPTNSPLRNYDNRQVFMLAKQVTIGSASYVVFFDGTVVGAKGRATPQRLQIEDVWIHDTEIDVTSTAAPARLFENATSIKIGQSSSVTRIEGAQSVKRADVSGNYPVLSTDHILSVDTSVGAATLTLPAISSVGDGHTVIIKDKSNNSYVNTITVVRTGSDTIDGIGASFVIQSDGASYVFVANSVSGDWELV